MSKSNTKKRIFALVMAVLLMVQTLPTSAFADTIGSDETSDSTYHTVTFVDADGTAIAMQLIVDGGTVSTFPEDPYKKGYDFTGWTCEGSEFTSSTKVTSDLTVSPAFGEVRTYVVTVKYVLSQNNEEVAPEVVRTYIKTDGAETIVSPAEITRTVGGIEGQLYPDKASVTVDPSTLTDDTVIYVYYTENGVTYYVHHRAVGSEADIKTEEFKGARGSTVAPKDIDLAGYTYYDNGGSIELGDSGNDLYVYYTADVYSVFYDTNGGSYVSPKRVSFGETVSTATDVTPTKQGYTFDKWYSDEALTSEAPSEVTVYEDVHLYAKWNPGTANYTVIYWKERQGENGIYDYISETVKTGKVGSTVAGGNDLSSSKVDSTYGSYYEFNSEKTNAAAAEITPDGKAIVNVYYDLKLLTVAFDYTTNLSSGYTIDTTGRTTSFTAKLGDDISALWPYLDFASTKGTSKMPAISWWRDNSNANSFASKRFFLTKDIVPDPTKTATYYAHYVNANNHIRLYYWLEQPDGTYVEDIQYREELYTDSTGFWPKDLPGYDHYGNDEKGHEQPSGGAGYRDGTNSSDYSDMYENFYFTLKSYTLTYNYPGSNEKESETVKYSVSLSDKNMTPSSSLRASWGIPENYIFDGWYYDSTCQNPVDFSSATMPASNLPLYAKFTAPEVTITFIAKGADPETWSDTIPYGGTASVKYPSKDGYAFLGWYEQEIGGAEFDSNQPLYEDTTVYAHWQKTKVNYTVHYYLDGTTQKLQDDRLVGVSKFTPGMEVTETAESITEYRPKARNVTAKLSGKDDELIFYYIEAAEVEYTVKYVVDGVETVAYTKTADASTQRITAVAPYETNDYYPDATIKGLELTADPEQNVITFYYTPYIKYNFSVKYVDDLGNPVPGTADASREIRIGDSWTFTDYEIDGYVKGEVEGNNGSLYVVSRDGDVEIVVHYKQQITISAEKLWDDNGNEANARPETITINLLADGQIKESKQLSSSESTVTFTPADKYAGGKEIKYTVSEDSVPGYKATVSGYTVTNKYDPSIDVTVTVIWDDNNDKLEKRPDYITLTLKGYVGGKEAVTVEKTMVPVTGTPMEVVFDGLDKYDEAGNEISYTVVEEAAVKDYSTTYDGLTVTNKISEEKITLKVEKKWTKSNTAGNSASHPTSVVFDIYANGIDSGMDITVSNYSGNTWPKTTSNTINNLPKYDKNGSEIEYTVVEHSFTDDKYYTTSVSGNASNGYTVTNNRVGDKAIVNVSAVWIDENNADGYRPESVTATVYYTYKEWSGGSGVITLTLNQNGNWTANTTIDKNNVEVTSITFSTFDNIDKYTCTYSDVSQNGNSWSANAKYEHTPSHNLTINYVDESGETLFTQHQETLSSGASYSVGSPSIEGYTLKDSSQATVSGTMRSSDITINVVYKPAEYTLRYVVDDEDYLNSPYTYKYKENIASVADPVKNGYTFDGWYEDSECEVKTTVPQTMPNHDVTVYGRFVIDPDAKVNVYYTAEVTADGKAKGTVTNPEDIIQVVSGEPINGSTASANAGYRFVGWYKDSVKVSDEAELNKEAAKSNLNTNSDGTYKDTTYTAKFIEVYSITYDWTGAPTEEDYIQTLPTDSKEYDKGSSYVVDTTYTSATVVEHKDAYGNVDGKWTFGGWDTEDGTITSNITVNGSWTYTPVEVNKWGITYVWTDAPTGDYAQTLPTDSTAYVNGSSYVVDKTYTSATVVEHKDAYGNVDGEWTFSGWNKSDGTITGNITISGSWIYEEVPVERISTNWIVYHVKGTADTTEVDKVLYTETGTGRINEPITKNALTETTGNFEGLVHWSDEESTKSIKLQKITDNDNTNVIYFHYVPNSYGYTVYYVNEAGQTIANAKVNSAEYASVISSNDEIITIPGYLYKDADKESLTIGTNSD